MRGGWKRKGRNRVAVDEVGGTPTQGSACDATLGLETESRWDSQTDARARERLRHDAVRAQLDLPDVFENLAGNHLKRLRWLRLFRMKPFVRVNWFRLSAVVKL